MRFLGLSVSALALILCLPMPDAAAQTELPRASVSDATATEGDLLAFVVRLDRPAPGPGVLRFSYETRDGTATAGADYRESSYLGFFQRGQIETTLLIPTHSDEQREGDETLHLVLSDPSAGLVLADASAIGTIKDPPIRPTPDKPEIALLSGEIPHTEGDDVYFTLAAHPTPSGRVTVELTVSQSGSFVSGDQIGRKRVTLGADGWGKLVIRTRDDQRNQNDGWVSVRLNASPRYTIRDGRASARVTILDNDAPAVSIAAGPRIGEGGTATFTLSANPRPVAGLRVDVNVSDSGDFAAAGQTGRRVVTIGSGGRATLSVRTQRDATDEADGAITATIVRGHRYTIGGSGSASVDVTDGGSPTPRVGISSGPDIREGSTATFTLNASPPPATSLQVSVNVAESGNYAANGQTGARTVTIGTDGTGTLRVSTVADDRDEADGTISVSLIGGTGYVVGSPASARVEVSDGGPPTPRVSISAGPATWEGASARFSLTADPAPGVQMQVAVDVVDSGDFAAEGQTGRRVVTVWPGGRGSFNVVTDADEVDEADGFITATVVKLGERYALGASASARVDVTDGGAPTPRISIAPGPGIEEGEGATFALTASPPPAADIDVAVAVTETGAYAADGETGTRSVTIGPSGSGILTVATEKDDVDEDDGAIFASIRNGEHYGLVSPTSARVEVSDGGAPTPRVGISPGPAIVEGNAATFSLTASPAPEADLTVSIEVAAQGDVDAAGETGTRTVTIGTDGTGVLSVTTYVDSGDAGGSITAAVLAGSGYAAGYPARARVGVSDGDTSTPQISIDPGPTVIEGDTATFTLRANPAPTASLEVNVSVDQWHDVARSEELGERSVTIGTDGTGILSVMTEDDDADEPGGTLIATLGEGFGYSVGFPDTARLAVNDNDVEEGDLAVSVFDAQVVEGDRDSHSRMRFRMTLSRAAEHRVLVFYDLHGVPDGTGLVSATAGSDYSRSGGWVVFSPGEIERYATVPIVDDDEEERPETFGLRIVKVYGAEIADGRATGTILPDPWDVEPGIPVISIVAEPATTEGGPARFTLVASPPPKEDLEVRVTILDAADSDSDDGDFVDDAGEGIRLVTVHGIGKQAAVLEYDKTKFTVATVDDDVDETTGPVTASIEFSDDGSYAIGSDWSASVIVYDNDGEEEALPAFTIWDASARESDLYMVFDISLDRLPRYGTATVGYQTVSGSARAGEDFVATHGTLTFRNGGETQQIRVELIDDDHDDPGESFRIFLAGARGATIADGIAVGTIENTDPVPAAWLARFGRTAWEQTMDAVERRLDRTGSAAPRAAVAGREMRAAVADSGADEARQLAALAAWIEGREAPGRTVSAPELLSGSEFEVAAAAPGADGGVLTLWGQGAYGRFEGQDGDLSVDGEVAGGTLGVDYAVGRWLTGLALSHSSGGGNYARPEARGGEVSGSLTGAYPYVGVAVVPERLTLWAAGGYGLGGLRLTPEGVETMETPIALLAGAAGVRATVVPAAAASGFSLSMNADGLLLRTTSEAGLAATTVDVDRVRLGMEGSYQAVLGGGVLLTPTVEVGLRRDGGNAETGFGMDVGGGLRFAHPGSGLSLGLSGRALVLHETADLVEWGASGALAWDPNPGSQLGPSLTVTPSIGAPAAGGAAALWSRQTLSGLEGADGGEPATGRVDARFAYGLPLADGVAAPWAGIGFSEGAREYRLGNTFELGSLSSTTGLSVELTATRREPVGSEAEHTLSVQSSIRW